MTLRVLALIPARAGSRGLRNKNIRRVGGVPLLVRAVRLARASVRRGESWRVVVSTDSARYAALARAAGAEVPFVRPAALATGRARLIDVVLHALTALEQHGGIFDVVIMLSAATPLTAVGDVRRALQRCRRLGVSAVSVTAETTPDAHRFGLEHGRLAAARTPHISRRQEGTPRVRLNGAVYVATPAWLRTFHQFVRANRTAAVVMPRERSADVENALDLDFARHLWRQQNRRRV